MGKRRGKGEGSVFKDSKGFWNAQIDLGWIDGKRKYRRVRRQTRKEAVDALQELLAQQHQGINIAPDQDTVGAYLERWLEDSVKPKMRPRTYEKYEGDIRNHIIPYIGKQRLTKLAPEHIDAMLNRLRAAGKANRTISNVRSVLRKALNQALKYGRVTRNVATLVETPRTSSFHIQPLDRDQARKLLDAVAGHRLEALYRVALSLGLRRGEICALRWQDVDLDAGTIRITGSLQRIQGKLQRVATKTTSSTATLSLPPSLIRALQAHKTRQDDEREHAQHWTDTDYVFCSEVGTALEPRNVNRHFKGVLERAGLPEHTRFHDLRHSCATMLIAQGEDLTMVKNILRHSQISITADFYVHIQDDMQRQALAEHDALLSDDILHLPPKKAERKKQ